MYVEPYVIQIVTLVLMPLALIAPLVAAGLAANYLMFLYIQLPTMLENAVLRERVKATARTVTPVRTHKRSYETPNTYSGVLTMLSGPTGKKRIPVEFGAFG